MELIGPMITILVVILFIKSIPLILVTLIEKILFPYKCRSSF